MSFEELLLSELPNLHRRLRRYPECEDLVQEAACRILRYRDRPLQPDQMRALLYRIAINELRSHYRKPPPNPVDELPDIPVDVDPICRITLRDLPLTDELRMAGLGHSYDEIADYLKVPIGTIKSRISRQRQGLMDHHP